MLATLLSRHLAAVSPPLMVGLNPYFQYRPPAILMAAWRWLPLGSTSAVTTSGLKTWPLTPWLTHPRRKTRFEGAWTPSDGSSREKKRRYSHSGQVSDGVK
ncbi:hypothetical protein N657DRAFT_273544 [Parathielavia appendiculata]|uniref:Uncharacterized protein n=1 Tax=Parathielavia appendiculata TaxID=2587402 RepID=A0AAN6U5V2_9PEZI|nr:hypothetical protein N657DRAFT_273544 [Parathielavia appendiculata]